MTHHEETPSRLTWSAPALEAFVIGEITTFAPRAGYDIGDFGS